MINCGRFVLFLVGVSLANSKNPGLPGLVFDDFDQLYTHPLVDGDNPRMDLAPEAEYNKLKDSRILEDPVNRTLEIAKYINDIDHRTIVIIQARTADIYRYEEAAGKEIQKISTAFRREGCLGDIKKMYKSVLETKSKNGDTNCKLRLDGKVEHYDLEFEGLVQTCLALQPLKVNQKFMRIYAEIYIALEKTYACSTKKTLNEVYDCIHKMAVDIKWKLDKTEKLTAQFKAKVDKYKRLAPKCCSFLKYYLTHHDKDSYCY
uniref:Hypothetical secreted protein n=1 Tax=Simulium nigrimanum TaxID=683695 RepID=D1FQ09_SIMNI